MSTENKREPVGVVEFVVGVVVGMAIILAAVAYHKPNNDTNPSEYETFMLDLAADLEYQRTESIIYSIQSEITDLQFKGADGDIMTGGQVPHEMPGWVDGWGNPLYYERVDTDPTRLYVIGSAGPDGEWNTQDDMWWDNHGRFE